MTLEWISPEKAVGLNIRALRKPRIKRITTAQFPRLPEKYIFTTGTICICGKWINGGCVNLSVLLSAVFTVHETNIYSIPIPGAIVNTSLNIGPQHIAPSSCTTTFISIFVSLSWTWYIFSKKCFLIYFPCACSFPLKSENCITKCRAAWKLADKCVVQEVEFRSSWTEMKTNELGNPPFLSTASL